MEKNEWNYNRQRAELGLFEWEKQEERTSTLNFAYKRAMWLERYMQNKEGELSYSTGK